MRQLSECTVLSRVIKMLYELIGIVSVIVRDIATVD